MAYVVILGFPFLKVLGRLSRHNSLALDLFNSVLAFLGFTPGKHRENRLAVPLSDLAGPWRAQ